MCYFKSPFDAVYERGDSVALAVISGNVSFPETTPFDTVSTRISFIFLSVKRLIQKENLER